MPIRLWVYATAVGGRSVIAPPGSVSNCRGRYARRAVELNRLFVIRARYDFTFGVHSYRLCR